MSRPHNDLMDPLLSRDEILYYLNLGLSQSDSEDHERHSTQQRSGVHVSDFRGSGFDYDDSRAYQGGDDLRKLNWRLMARTSQLYTKVFKEEREASVMLVIDRRASMRFGTRRHLKVTRAVQLACYLAGCSVRQASAVGITLLQPDSVQIQPQRSLARIRDGLASAAAACPPLTDTVDEPTLKSILAQLQLASPGGSRLILISDFHDLEQSDRVVLMQLAAQHQLQAFQVLDPIETSLPESGVWQINDYSDATPIKVNANERIIKQQYRDAMQSKQTQIDTLFSSCRIAHECVYTDVSFDSVLRHIRHA